MTNKQRIEVLKEELHMAGVTMDTLAAYIGVTRMTIYNRMKRPENFTIGELRAIQELTGMSDNVILQLIK